MKTLDEIYGGPVGYALYLFMWLVVLPLAITIASAIGYVIYRVLCDAFRFGRQHLSLPLMLGVGALFSGVGCTLAGMAGVVLGLLFLAVYGFGWWRGEKHAHDLP